MDSRNIKNIKNSNHDIKKALNMNNVVWTKEPDVYLAQDSDFVKVNDYWVYRGAELEIKIPSTIQGESITSYQSMFSGDSTYNATSVTRVVSDNPNVTNMGNMFYGSKTTTLDLSSFDTSNVTNMSTMFYGSKATTLDLSSFDTSKVTSIWFMFQNSSATVGYARTQADADKFNASSTGKPAGLNFIVKPYIAQDSDFVKVDKYWVYRGSELEIEIPHVIQGKSVTSYRYMFGGDSTYNATSVTRVVSDNPNVTNMSKMFSGSKATTLDLSSFDTSNVTNMYGMFESPKATTLDLSGFNTSKVTTMAYMFAYSKVTTLDLSSFDTSNVTSMSNMFNGSVTTVGYARTQADADKFNASSNKPAGLNFVVKP